MSGTSRSTATFYVECDQNVFLFYSLSDLHMPQPTFSHVRDKDTNHLAYQYSQPVFSVVYLKSTSLSLTFTLTGLSPGHQYQIYLFPMNQNGISSPPSLLTFTTQPSQPLSILTMKLLQTVLEETTKAEYFLKLSQLL